MTMIKPLLGLVLLAVLAVPAQAQRTPQEMLDTARAGAPGLALAMMDRLQPDRERQLFAWLSWEQARLEILRGSQRWSDLAARVAGHPSALPPEFRDWAGTQQAQAYLNLGQADESRRVLRALLWADRAQSSPAQIRLWRQLVIESYVVEDRLDDARVALQRYNPDYSDNVLDERLLWARVLLRLDDAEAAQRVLQDQTGAEAEALRALASLRAPGAEVDELRRAAQTAAQGKDLKPVERARFWWIAAEAAAAQKDEMKRAAYLEQALQQDRLLGTSDRVFRIDGDTLWESYLRLGRALGNARQLLIGDDAAWLVLADGLDDQQVLERRGVLAVVAVHGTSPEGRAESNLRLLNSLLAVEGNEEVVAALYLQSVRFPDLASIPEVPRQYLADYALRGGEVRLASRLMEGVVQPPSGVDPYHWQLRRARIHILGGHEDEGIDTLYTVLAGQRELTKDQADQFMQVVFDLQTVKRHDAAITLFTALAPRLTDAQQQREVLFWQADSYKAQGDYERAAWLYMQSAILHDPHAFDPWGQTSRFYAAEALAEAGLVEDARAIYQRLLQATGEPARQLVLRQKLQALPLQE